MTMAFLEFTPQKWGNGYPEEVALRKSSSLVDFVLVCVGVYVVGKVLLKRRD